MPDKARNWSRGSVVDWANETFHVARTQIYRMLPGTDATDAPVVLPSDYAQRKGNVTRTQLERAGVRLAAVLNKALGR